MIIEQNFQWDKLGLEEINIYFHMVKVKLYNEPFDDCKRVLLWPVHYW